MTTLRIVTNQILIKVYTQQNQKKLLPTKGPEIIYHLYTKSNVERCHYIVFIRSKQGARRNAIIIFVCKYK